MFVKLFYKKEEKVFTLFINVLFAISALLMTFVVTKVDDIKTFVISISVAAVFIVFFTIYKKVQNKVFKDFNLPIFLTSAFLSAFLYIELFETFMYSHEARIIDFMNTINLSALTDSAPYIVFSLVVFGSFPSIVFCMYFAHRTIISLFKRIYNGTSKLDKHLLLSFFTIFSILIIVFYSLTVVFYGTKSAYNIIYRSDTWDHFVTNCWVNISAPENYIHQSLFGVFSIPISIVPYTLSKVLFFIPNIYAYLLGISQLAVALVTIYLIVDLLDLEEINRLLVIGIFASSFSFLLFIFNLEQYIFSTFWPVLFIWCWLKEKRNNTDLFIAGAGSLVTNAALLPLLIEKNTFKYNAIKVVKAGLLFIGCFFVFGQGKYIINCADLIKLAIRWSGKDVPFVNVQQQYTNFVVSCFVFPKSHIFEEDGVFSIQLDEVTGFNYIGITILLVCIISIIFNRKNIFAWISFAWILLSYSVLGLLGWGSKENGMILYSYLFGWSFFVMVILLIELIPNKWRFIKYGIYGCTIIAFLIFNIIGMTEIIKFGIEYYPR